MGGVCSGAEERLVVWHLIPIAGITPAAGSTDEAVAVEAAAPSTAARIPNSNPCTRFHWQGWLLWGSGRSKESLHLAAALR